MARRPVRSPVTSAYGPPSQGAPGGTLGIIGETPQPLSGAIRASRYDRLTAQTGDLDGVPAGRYLAVHAACHALMNGVGRVVVAPVETTDWSDPRAWGAARFELERQGPVDLVVAPGVVDEASVAALCEAHGTLVSEGRDATLWLDSPDPTAAGVLAWRQRWSSFPRLAVVAPAVPTLSPGRRAMELLPATCVIGALALRVTEVLRGAHEPSRRFDEAEVAELRAAGVGILVPTGMRRQVALLPPLGWPGPRPASEDEGAIALLDAWDGQPGVWGEVPDDPVAQAIALRVEEACAGEPARAQGPGLWRSLERRVTAALRPLQARGTVVGFRVRCDAETNEGSAQPVVEVGYQLPARRPGRVVVRVQPLVRGE